MTTAQTDRWNEITGRIRINAIWTVAGSFWVGLQVATAMWKPQVFFSLPLLLWGTFVVFWLFRFVVELRRLHHAVLPGELKTIKWGALQLMAYTLCTAVTSFCFAIGLAAAKSFGGMYVVAAVGLGTLMAMMCFVIERRIKRLSPQFSNP